MYKAECEALISIALNFGVDSLKKYKVVKYHFINQIYLSQISHLFPHRQ